MVACGGEGQGGQRQGVWLVWVSEAPPALPKTHRHPLLTPSLQAPASTPATPTPTSAGEAGFGRGGGGQGLEGFPELDGGIAAAALPPAAASRPTPLTAPLPHPPRRCCGDNSATQGTHFDLSIWWVLGRAWAWFVEGGAVAGAAASAPLHTASQRATRAPLASPRPPCPPPTLAQHPSLTQPSPPSPPLPCQGV